MYTERDRLESFTGVASSPELRYRVDLTGGQVEAL